MFRVMGAQVQTFWQMLMLQLSGIVSLCPADQNLCERCKDAHQRVTITRDHRILPLIDFPDGEYKETPNRCKELGTKDSNTVENQDKTKSVTRSWFDESVTSCVDENEIQN